MASKHKPVQHINTIELFRLKPLSACVRMAIAGGVFLSSISPSFAELPVPAQVWATMGSATNQVIGNTLQINQQSERAILNWESFNVGAENQVNFQQPGSSAIALNRIFQNDPSQILGKITANGQIYLYNQNGFVFGKDSTVDVNTLVASTLNISNDVFKNGGIVNEFNNTKGAALEGKSVVKTANDPRCKGEICVDAGAKIHVGENGRLIMAAPTVTNAGTLEADKYGQIILVASKDKVYLQPADANSPFAGLLVEVGSGGKVSNIGDVLVRQGNVTLAGFAVNQAGRVSATTSVSVKGSIRLLAREGQGLDGDKLVGTGTTRNKDLNDDLGTESKVTFAPGSVTQVIGDSDGGKAIDEQAQPFSYLEASAHTVHLQSGAAIGVPGGRVDITATGDPVNPIQSNKGRIVLESGALVDVSGTKNISASVKRNVVEVPVQSYELRDSPLQKGGVLQGKTILVDIREKNGIVDISGALARIERSIDERLGKGGVINMTASGDIIVNNNAVFNISGGTIDYKEGYINTSKLLTDYGKIIDISDADPNEHYQAVYGIHTESHQKWGVTKLWQANALSGKGRFEQGYQEGLDAGALNIATSKLSWNGDLVAGAASGLYQRSPDTLSYGGELSIDTKIFNSLQNVLFQTQKNGLDIALDDKFPKGKNSRPADLVLSTDLINKSGIQKISVKTLGKGTIASDANINLTSGKYGEVKFVDRPKDEDPIKVTGSQFGLISDDINVKGKIYSPGGTIRLGSGFDFDAEAGQRVFNASAELKIASTADLDVSGRWVNDFALGLDATPTESIAIDAGAVTLAATGDLTMRSGSAIKANGGAWLALNGQLTEGKAGSIDLGAIGNGSEPSLLHLNGRLSAYGLSEGGRLSLSSGSIVVGAAEAAELADSPLVLGVKDGKIALPSSKSFGEINLNSNFGDLLVKGQAALSLIQQNLVLKENFREQSSGRSIVAFSDVEVLPEHLRKPVDLTLTAKNNIKLETGSSILGDKQASVKLAATQGGIYVDGLVDAPAGSINLTISASANPYNPAQAIWLGQHGQLLASGTTLMNPTDELGRRTGEVLDAGDVTLTAERGYVVLEEGSKIDVSGTRATLDLLSDDTGSIRYEPTEVGSNAGKIAVVAAEGAVLDGGLKGVSGTASTNDGRMDLALNRSVRNPPQELIDLFPFGALTLNVRQGQQKILDNKAHFGDDLDALGLNGKATVSADKITEGGFGDVRLATINVNKDGTNSENSTVNFLGDVNLSADARIDIDAPNIGWLSLNNSDKGSVNLNTAYFRAGSSLIRESAQLPVMGEGAFTVNAQWAELGGASRWNGFKLINLNTAHDLRTVGVLAIDGTKDDKQQSDYLGEFVAAGDVNLTASQIYPSTLTKFTFAVENNPQGQITVSRSGNTDTTPLAAAGVLNFSAPVINQNGIVKAPFGTVNLDAGTALTLGDGSLTSVSGAGQLIPFGVTYNGLDWLYPLEKNNILVFNAPPEKKLVLSAPEVVLQKGSNVDLSGGGDLLGYEFQPGIGGSSDYLAVGSQSYNGGFAIVPNLGASIAPYDPLQSAGFDHAVGSQVYLSGTGTLAAGFYTLLPARYALLPGAYLVTPQANTQDQRATIYNAAGLPIVAGYQSVAGTGAKDSRWSGFLVESGSDIRKHSQYDEQKANSFYVQHALRNDTSAPILPVDSGQITIKNAQTKLSLEGDFNVASPGGRGARMDIAANRLKIVKNLSATPTIGTLEILADDLTGLHVDSLLLGGERSNNVNTGATDLTITSEEITFAEDSHVQVTDLIAGATKQVSVKSGATLVAEGEVNTGDTLFNIIGDGALLRVSADRQVVLNRTEAPGNGGELLIESGSMLSASKSMLLDASHSTTLVGDIQMQGGSLNLSANAINIGEVDELPANALNLSNAKLLNLAVDELVLNSRDTINFYGNIGQKDQNGLWNPLTFNNLVMNAAGFTGFGHSDQMARLSANNLQLQNILDVTAKNKGTGQGQLDISANNYSQGNGIFDVNGFNSVNINVGEGFVAKGNGVLNVDANFNLTSGYIATETGNKFDINVTGHQAQVNGNGSKAVPSAISYGGTVNLVADAINFNGRALLPSGKLGLLSLTGDLLVGSQAVLDLAGRRVGFADAYDYTPGGIFSATAEQGKITLAEGSNVDLNNGGGSAAGGKLDLHAVNKNVELSGTVNANAGSAVIEVGDFNTNAGFDGLMGVLESAKVSKSIYVRSHQADIVQNSGNSISSEKITLVADKGAIDLSGKLHADGVKEGGVIELLAADKIALEDGAEVTAIGTGDSAKGGKVILSSANNQNGIEINKGSLLDVSGGAKADGGKIFLQALRTDTDNNGIDDDIAIQPIAGTVQGYSQFYAEGFKKYDNQSLGNDGEINSKDIGVIKKDIDDYMTTATVQKINGKLGSGIKLRPGIEINYDEDLTLKDKWDLVDWRYAEQADKTSLPGSLKINVRGNLELENSLTDGFRTEIKGSPLGNKDVLQTGDSWTYQLVAGADLASADKTASINAPKDLTIGINTQVRTGSGDIELGASGNVVFRDKTSAVYNAGKAEEGDRYGSLGDIYVTYSFYGEYPLAGGDLIINAGKDIKGALNQDPFINKWLVRQGIWSENKPTAWGVDFVNLAQNVGSFGGGKVEINAEGNISDLAVMMPTTGKQIGKISDPTNEYSKFDTNELQIEGGGKLQVKSGGDITGGVYYLGQGEGSIAAGGNITGSIQPVSVGVVPTAIQGLIVGPQILMGDTEFSLSANKNVSIAAVSDPMILHSQVVESTLGEVNFFSYGDKSALYLKSLSGDVHLNSDASVITGTFQANSAQLALSKIYPASLYGTAFGGSVLIDGKGTDLALFPSANANLSVFAKENIAATVDGVQRLAMSDFDPSLLPKALAPFAGTALDEKDNNIVAHLNPFASDSSVHAQEPVHRGDKEPVRIVTQQGDIKAIKFNLPKKSVIESGRDLNNISIEIQHANRKGDVSVISAARDLRYGIERNPDFGTLETNTNKIEIAGSGNVLIKTGRNFDLGTSVGLSTVGNTYNQNLASGGAGVTVLAGLNGAEPNYLGLFGLNADVIKYAENYNKFQQLVTEFMRNRTGNTVLTTKTAFEDFSKLDAKEYVALQPKLDALVSSKYVDLLDKIKNVIVRFEQNKDPGLTETAALDAFVKRSSDEYLSIQPQLNTLVNKILFSELKETGSASAADATLGNERGYKAIEALYPGNAWKGDLNLFFSKLQTLNDGDINLLVPGGEINAGVAVVADDLKKESSELGIATQGKGDINAFVNNDFIVNQSRVFALGGGDILIWSSVGNIDAGRGAKSAIAAPPPIIGFDDKGNLMVTFPPEFSGSGIRTASPVGKKIKAGNVALFAPGGIVNAGEAGIAGNNVTISATAVLGANNIQVGGVSSGVPAASAGSLAGALTGVSNLTANVSQMAQASTDMSKDNGEAGNKGIKLGTLSVDIIGFGDEPSSNQNDEKNKNKPRPSS